MDVVVVDKVVEEVNKVVEEVNKEVVMDVVVEGAYLIFVIFSPRAQFLG